MPELHRLTDRIFTVSSFLSAGECDEHIALAESIGFDDAPVTTAFGPRIMKDFRNNTRVMLDDNARADDLWSRIREYVPQTIEDWSACGVNERLRFYRYDVGQQFDWHYDGAFEREDGERSRLTFMVYLNEGFEGGDTTLEDVNITPARGLALLFIHQIRHKGQPVTRGRKYVLRTDVMYRHRNA